MGVLAVAYFITNVAGLHASETSFWQERSAAARHRSPAPLFAGPVDGNLLSPAHLAALSSVPSGVKGIRVLGSPPSDALKKLGELPNLVAPFGDIREIHFSSRPNAPFIVHLQDAHEVEEAQRHLAGLVETLRAKQRVSLVGVEGAVGAFDLREYRSSPNPNVTRTLADVFLKLGYLTGPEVAAITSVDPTELWGVEDLTLYREHIGAFLKSETERKSVQSRVAELSRLSDAGRDKIYSPALRSADDHRLAYLAHRESLGDYARALWEAHAGPATSYPNLTLLLEALRRERELDFKEVERERLKLAEVLSRRLSADDADALVRESLEFRAGRRTGGEYHRFLRTLCEANGVPLTAYGRIKDYLSYLLVTERIRSEALFQELSDLEEETLSSLARTEDERRLVAARRGLALVNKLIQHSLNPDEWRAYQNMKSEIESIPKTLETMADRSADSLPSLPPDLLAPFELFCRRALDRNDALVNNLLTKMNAGGFSSAVLVAGGFHTAGIARILREKDISYVVVSPKISSVPEETSHPLGVFVRAPLPLETLLAGEVIHLAYPCLAQKSKAAVSAAPTAPERQATSQFTWGAVQDDLDSMLLKKSLNSPFASLVRNLSYFSKTPLNLKDGLIGYQYEGKGMGKRKSLTVLLVPKTDEMQAVLARNGFSKEPVLKFDFTVAGVLHEVRLYGSASWGGFWTQALHWGKRWVGSVYAEMRLAVGNAIRLEGGKLGKEEDRTVAEFIKDQITKGKAKSLFEDRNPRVTGDREIKKLVSVSGGDENFLNRLRLQRAEEVQKGRLTAGFEIIVLDDEIPFDVMLHPGSRRQQAYVSFPVLQELSNVFESLNEDPGHQRQFLHILMEAFRHEEKHVTSPWSRIPLSEIEVDKLAPSFRARALFRVLHIQRTLLKESDVKPNWKEFLRRSEGPRSSYLHAFMDLNSEQHIDMAKNLLNHMTAHRKILTPSHDPNNLEILLAQLHLGAVLFNTDPEDPLFYEALNLLETGHILDINPETGDVFFVWKFAMDLIRQYMLINDGRSVEKMNQLISSLERLSPWVRGTSTTAGDSTFFPIGDDDTTVLNLSLETARERINEMPDDQLAKEKKKEILLALRPGPGTNSTKISKRHLEWIGEYAYLHQTTVAQSVAGKGTRFAEIEYTVEGEKKISDRAKAVYSIPWGEEGDKEFRSLLEVSIAGLTAQNKEGAHFSLDLHTSHFTNEDIVGEIERLGYHQYVNGPKWSPLLAGLMSGTIRKFRAWAHLSTPKVYRHSSNQWAPIIRISSVQKGHLFDASGDFFKIDSDGREGQNVRVSEFWPDGHDTSMIDYILDGRAYEDYVLGNEKKRYRVVSNADNLLGSPNKTSLGIMRLTGVPLINEVGVKPDGEKGGSAVKLKAKNNFYNGFYSQDKGLVEEFQFNKEMLNQLTPAQAKEFMPLFNTGNYLIDVIEFTRAVFMEPGASDPEVVALLKKFHDARRDPHSLMKERFKHLHRLRKATQFFEQDKRYPAYQPANLAGTWTWALPTLFLEVPVVDTGGKFSRWEPMKENPVNFENWLTLIRQLVTRLGVDTRLDKVSENSDLNVKEKMLFRDLVDRYKPVTNGDGGTPTRFPTLGEVKTNLEDLLNRIARSRRRVKENRHYEFFKRAGASLLNMFAGDDVEKIKAHPFIHLGIIPAGESVARGLFVVAGTILAMAVGVDPFTAFVVGYAGGGILFFSFAHKIVNWILRRSSPEVGTIQWTDKLLGSFITATFLVLPSLVFGLPLDPSLSTLEQTGALLWSFSLWSGGVLGWIAHVTWDTVIVYKIPEWKDRILLSFVHSSKRVRFSNLDPDNSQNLLATLDLNLAPNSRLAQDINGWKSLHENQERIHLKDDPDLKDFTIEIVGAPTPDNPIQYLSTLPSEAVSVAVRGGDTPTLYIARGAWGEEGSKDRGGALEALRWQAKAFKALREQTQEGSKAVFQQRADQYPAEFRDWMKKTLRNKGLAADLPEKFHPRRITSKLTKVYGDVVHIAMEMDPFIKIGGLADVTSALSWAQKEYEGQNSAVILPMQKAIKSSISRGVFTVQGREFKIEKLGTYSPRSEKSDLDYDLYGTTFDGVKVYFVDMVGWHEKPDRDGYFTGTDGPAQSIRFSYCAVDAMERLKEDKSIKKKFRLNPGLIHGHDWHVAMALAFAATRDSLKSAGRVFSIHNGAYQGVVPAENASDTFRWLNELGLPEELNNFDLNGLECNRMLNLLKAGIIMADVVTPVSPQYAHEIAAMEIFGNGLTGFYRYYLYKILGELNGAPRNNPGPSKKPLKEQNLEKGLGLAVYDYQTYDQKSLSRRQGNKVALRQALKLDPLNGREETPLHVMIGRFTEQKGLKDVVDAMGDILKKGEQVCFLASPDRDEDKKVFMAFMQAMRDGSDFNAPEDPKRSNEINQLLDLLRQYPKEIRINPVLDPISVPYVLAAADFVWMPSKWEPCGLVQMLAFSYGAIPVVTDVGGLHDTVIDPMEDPTNANGFKVQPGETFVQTLDRARQMRRERPNDFEAMQVRGMGLKFDWKSKALDFTNVYLVAQAQRRPWERGGDGENVLEGKPSLVCHDSGNLEGTLLGGPAQIIPVGRLDVQVESTRKWVGDQRQKQSDAQKVLDTALRGPHLNVSARTLSEKNVWRLGRGMGKLTRERSGTLGTVLERMGRWIFRLLKAIEVLREGAPLFVRGRTPWTSHFVRGFNHNLFEAEDRILSSINSRRAVVMEISETLLSGNPTEQDKTRLTELRVLQTQKSNLRNGQLMWMVPPGQTNMDRLWEKYPDLSALRDLSAPIRSKADFQSEEGVLYSVNKVLVSMNEGRTLFPPTDLYLLNRDEWMFDSNIPEGLVTILISLVGNLTYDATVKVNGDLRRLIYLRVNA